MNWIGFDWRLLFASFCWLLWTTSISACLLRIFHAIIEIFHPFVARQIDKQQVSVRQLRCASRNLLCKHIYSTIRNDEREKEKNPSYDIVLWPNFPRGRVPSSTHPSFVLLLCFFSFYFIYTIVLFLDFFDAFVERANNIC